MSRRFTGENLGVPAVRLRTVCCQMTPYDFICTHTHTHTHTPATAGGARQRAGPNCLRQLVQFPGLWHAWHKRKTNSENVSALVYFTNQGHDEYL
jgi:hypothetical protein